MERGEMNWYEPGEAEKVERELQAKRYQIEELEEELAEQRITAATNDCTITVVVAAGWPIRCRSCGLAWRIDWPSGGGAVTSLPW